MQISRSLLCALVSLALLSGCASGKYGEQITTVNYYPRCYAPISDLREADTSENKTVIAGGVLGTLAGALVGYAATGRAEGALVGAAVGGVAGTGIGYAKAKQERIADDNRRMASYLVDIDGDISGMDRATAAASVARDCYDKEFRQAVAAYKNKAISRDELNRRYQEIKDGTTEAGRILGVMIASSSEREQMYQEAITEEARKANQPVPVVRTASTGSSSTSRKAASSTGTRKPQQTKAKASDPAPAPAATASNTSTSGTTKKTSATIKKTPAPQKGDNSLQAVAQNTQRLNESTQAAADEQALIREMQAEMDSTLATLTS